MNFNKIILIMLSAMVTFALKGMEKPQSNQLKRTAYVDILSCNSIYGIDPRATKLFYSDTLDCPINSEKARELITPREAKTFLQLIESNEIMPVSDYAKRILDQIARPAIEAKKVEDEKSIQWFKKGRESYSTLMPWVKPSFDMKSLPRFAVPSSDLSSAPTVWQKRAFLVGMGVICLWWYNSYRVYNDLSRNSSLAWYKKPFEALRRGFVDTVKLPAWGITYVKNALIDDLEVHY